MESGEGSHKEALFCMSTGQNELVISTPKSYNSLDTDHAFYSYLMKEHNVTLEQFQEKFEYHPKIIS